jgi:peptidyl-tRNA hydrolase, PTH2 family
MNDGAGERTAKQVIVIRRDLKMRRGKEIAQGAHASMAWLSRRLADWSNFTPLVPGSYSNSARAMFSDAERKWLQGAFTKVTCQVSGLEALEKIAKDAATHGVMVHVITDAGRTEFGGIPTVTALAVGPDWPDLVDKVTGDLELY